MKCVECKLAKFDGKNWTCPAYPYAQITMYTENPECTASAWYPKHLEYQLDVANDQLTNVTVYIEILDRAIAEAVDKKIPDLKVNALRAYRDNAVWDKKEIKARYDKFYSEYTRLRKEGLCD